MPWANYEIFMPIVNIRRSNSNLLTGGLAAQWWLYFWVKEIGCELLWSLRRHFVPLGFLLISEIESLEPSFPLLWSSFNINLFSIVLSTTVYELPCTSACCYFILICTIGSASPSKLLLDPKMTPSSNGQTFHGISSGTGSKIVNKTVLKAAWNNPRASCPFCGPVCKCAMRPDDWVCDHCLGLRKHRKTESCPFYDFANQVPSSMHNGSPPIWNRKHKRWDHGNEMNSGILKWQRVDEKWLRVIVVWNAYSFLVIANCLQYISIRATYCYFDQKTI
jgi:hypothetical protein